MNIAIWNVILNGGGSGGVTPITDNVFITLSGTALSTTELAIVSGGTTIIMTLQGDTWHSTIGGNNAKTTALINGLSAPVFDTVKSGITYTAVTRNSDTVVTILLPALASYAITEIEKLIVTVPSTCFTAYAYDIVNFQQPTIFSEVDYQSLYRFDFTTNLRATKANSASPANGEAFTNMWNYTNKSQSIRLGNPSGANLYNSSLGLFESSSGQSHASFAIAAGSQEQVINGDFHVFAKFLYRTTGGKMFALCDTADNNDYLGCGGNNFVSSRINTSAFFDTACTAMGDNTEQLVDIVRSGTNVKTYINGVLSQDVTINSAALQMAKIGRAATNNRSGLKYWTFYNVAKTTTQAARIRTIIDSLT